MAKTEVKWKLNGEDIGLILRVAVPTPRLDVSYLIVWLAAKSSGHAHLDINAMPFDTYVPVYSINLFGII